MSQSPSPERAVVLPARKPPTFLTAVARVFDLSLGQMLWSRRTIFMALIVGGPVLIALLVRLIGAASGSSVRVHGSTISGTAAFGMMFWLFYLRFTVPVLAVFYATALIADEIEDKTVTYLFTRPIRRGAVVIGKYLAYLTCAVLVVLPSVMIVYFVMTARAGTMAADFPLLLKDLGIVAVALAVYGAVFTFVGVWFKRPLVTGLVFLFGWEPAVFAFPGYFKKLTVMHYVQAFVPHAMPADDTVSFLQTTFRDVPSLATCIVVLATTGVVFLLLASRVVERHEYVLEQ